MPCTLISFEPNDRINTAFTCQTAAKPMQIKSEYHGGRGISGFSENLLTSFSNLGTFSQSLSLNTKRFKLNEAKYEQNTTGDLTLWLRGYLSPQRSSNYELSLNSNVDAKLFISLSQLSADKVLNFMFTILKSFLIFVLHSYSKNGFGSVLFSKHSF
jgi:hypothetical protein